ncbi:MAG: delta-aminolevulinic acid dehydratase [Deltaproteobacteria bacterium SM23_61]|nr:MAG: delta-aminolevulinic acid dehydratase [Deltaproteobacteria bacterium SM23_61]
MYFPLYRPRRLRTSETLRKMVRETRLSPEDFIYPLFVVHGRKVRHEIESMPGIAQVSVDLAVREAEEACKLSIPAVILFGIPKKKDLKGTEAYSAQGIIQQAIRAIKRELPQVVIITDVCLCEYTSHGHCGIVVDGEVHNDTTLAFLARMALSHAEAGADMVAPSDMMDGRVKAIRDLLDRKGFENIPILSYAAKHASVFYGPFREAAESTPQFGDRKSYQMDPANAREALREVRLDVQEGADIIMVKPALPYLDIIRKVREEIDLPVGAYNVSGEYTMIKAAAQQGWIDGERAMMEVLTAIKRAGADLIITYFAKEASRVLKKG